MSGKDLIQDILAEVAQLQPAFTPDQAERVERAIRAMWGGSRYFVGKDARRTPAGSERIYQDAISAAPAEEVMRKHGISRATLYRRIKRRPN